MANALGTLNRDEKQSRFINHSSVLPLTTPHPCLSISVLWSVMSSRSLKTLQPCSPSVLTLLPVGVKAISQKKGEICLVTEGSILH